MAAELGCSVMVSVQDPRPQNEILSKCHLILDNFFLIILGLL